MTEQPATLTTNETLEYIRDNTGRTTLPHRNILVRRCQEGHITPHSIGGGVEHHGQSTYLLEDVQLLCERINSGYWRKQGQDGRVYPKKKVTLEQD